MYLYVNQLEGCNMKNSPVRVTDHAVVRFLEHVAGFDLEPVRDLIRCEAQNGVLHGASGVRLNGVRYALRDNAVVTLSCRKPKSFEELRRRFENVR